MRKMLLVFLFTVALCSFTKVAFLLFLVEPVPVGVEEPFYKTVRNFYEYASVQDVGPQEKERMAKLSVKFGPVVSTYRLPLAGVCHYEFVEVWIEEATWNKMPPRVRQDLIDHELGHCILGRIHRHATDEDGTHVSMMAPGLLKSKEDFFGNNVLRKELFNKELYHLLPKLKDEAGEFTSANSQLVPFMMIDPYSFNRIYEDVLNGDTPETVKAERLQEVLKQAKEVEGIWKNMISGVEAEGRNFENLSVFEKNHLFMEEYFKKQSQGL